MSRLIKCVAFLFVALGHLEAAKFNPKIITPKKIPPAYHEPINPDKPPVYFDPNNPNNPPAPIAVIDSQAILTVIENQLNAIQNNDIEAAYYNYTSNAFRGETSFDEFKYFVTSYNIFTHNKNAFFGAPEITENNAIIRGSLFSTSGDSYKVDYYFIKENGIWKILGIQLGEHTKVRQVNPKP